MESKTPVSGEVPTALPGFEEEDAREKLLLEATTEEPDSEAEEEDDDLTPSDESAKPKKRGWQVLRTLGAFALFVCILALAVSWFFGMGWFSEQKPRPISRDVLKDALNSPATEDEKLKMALSMVAAKAPASSGIAENAPSSDEDPSASDKLASTTAIPTGISEIGADRTNPIPVANAMQNSPGVADQRVVPEVVSTETKTPAAVRDKGLNISTGLKNVSDEARGRSLFFGISKKIVEADKSGMNTEPLAVQRAVPSAAVANPTIPFGTLLPVRLVGSIYTFRNSGGFVRMELTRPIDGKGYSYPAGTTLVGNVRGGESIRAFVTIIGLIDPVSGELVRFGGELLGRDGGSGIEGRRRKLTSGWSRFFSGLKDTAASVLGSVGTFRSGRSGSTVILSEPIRKGSESMSEDLSDALLKNGKDDTFIEVLAGANGYVLVTGLPENSSAVANELRPGVGNR